MFLKINRELFQSDLFLGLNQNLEQNLSFFAQRNMIKWWKRFVLASQHDFKLFATHLILFFGKY